MRAAQLSALVLVFVSGAKADQLDTQSWNFQLAGGGGGSSAVLNLTTPIEIYCNDFSHDIYVPHSNYSANLSGVTTSTFNANTTRFGTVTSWTTVTINDDGPQNVDDLADSGYINGANALGRYQMGAYLASQYNFAGQGNNYNNGIQMAIWEILDPKTYTNTPLSINPGVNLASLNAALEMAAEWYHVTSGTQRDTYLSGYRIVSDATMTSGGANGPRVGGFQEQITRMPEPGSVGMVAFGLMALALGARRGRKRKSRGPVY